MDATAKRYLLVVNAGQRLELRAANQHRPTLAVRDMITIRGGADAEITLNGLLITGGALRVRGGQ